MLQSEHRIYLIIYSHFVRRRVIGKITPQLNSVHRERYRRGAPCGAGVRHRRTVAEGTRRPRHSKPKHKSELWGHSAFIVLADDCNADTPPRESDSFH